MPMIALYTFCNENPIPVNGNAAKSITLLDKPVEPASFKDTVFYVVLYRTIKVKLILY
jgi:hypothetical protein